MPEEARVAEAAGCVSALLPLCADRLGQDPEKKRGSSRLPWLPLCTWQRV